jgi:histidine triad (HIT) family protein
MIDCTFCKIYNSKQEIIFDNEHFFARFDKYPITPGHVNLISKRHVASFFDLRNQEWTNLKSAFQQIVKVIEITDYKELYQSFIDEPLNERSVEFCKKMQEHIGINKKPDGYNIGVNEGEAAGRTIHHMHIHIIPRFSGDVEDYVGGVRHIIPNMGNYRK